MREVSKEGIYSVAQKICQCQESIVCLRLGKVVQIKHSHVSDLEEVLS